MYSPRSANLSRTINCGTQRSVGKERNRKGGRLHTLPRTLASGANLDSCLDRDRDFGFHRNLSHTVHLTFPDYSMSSLQHLSTGSEMYNIRFQYDQVIVKIPQKLFQGFQVYPQLPQRFTVDPLPRNPHRSEYPREPVVMFVELQLGQWLLRRKLLTRSIALV